MCLIVYAPKGELIDRELFNSAAEDNPDGIGIMSREGVHKFLGPKRVKKAYRVVRRLAESGTPYGVHFRWTTHGLTNKANCHPFKAPSGAWVMHNGVIKATAALATGTKSDTVLFVENYMHSTPAPSEPGHKGQMALFEYAIGYSSKLLIMHPNGEFSIANEHEGLWVDGVWYSNTYSFPRGFFDDRKDEGRTSVERSWMETDERCASCNEPLFAWEASEGLLCDDCNRALFTPHEYELDEDEVGHEYADRMCRA